MTRTISSGLADAVAQPQIAPVFFIEADFSGGFARAWTGIGTVTWDGKLWLGNGELLSLGKIEESREIEATSVAVALAGVDPALVSIAYGDFSQGRPLRIWLGMMDVAAGTVVSDPVAIFQGRMDTISDSDDGSTAVITVTAESNLADLKRPRARFLSDQDQQRLFPSDRSFRYMPSLQDRPLYWGTRDGSPQIPSIQT